VTALLGEAGTGKTTLIRATLDSSAAQKTFVVYLNNPVLKRHEFLEFLAREFRIEAGAASSKTALLEKLARALMRLRNNGLASALIIDEAQSLPHELLEEIRLLSNVETADQKMLSIVLAGQPELAQRLNERSLRQLKQRVEYRCELRPLDLQETGAYIAFRIKVAGGNALSMFSREAVQAIFEASNGVPRAISVICNNVLITGFALNRRLVSADVVREVCRDFDLEEKTVRFFTLRPEESPRPYSEPETDHISHGPSAELIKLATAQFRRFHFFQPPNPRVGHT
jgi:general secretion pathway protein A